MVDFQNLVMIHPDKTQENWLQYENIDQSYIIFFLSKSEIWFQLLRDGQCLIFIYFIFPPSLQLEQVEELRASERNLRVRVKSLTNELAVYKRGRQPARSNCTDKRSSIERLNKLRKNSSSRQRSLSRERNSSYSRDIERSSSHDRLYLPQRRDRSSSRDRPSSAPNRSRHSESPSSVRGSFHVSRSPSPAGNSS